MVLQMVYDMATYFKNQMMTTNVKVFDVVNKTSFWFNCYFIVNSNLKHDGNFSMNVVRAGMLG